MGLLGVSLPALAPLSPEYHFLCMSANANGGGLIAYGSGGGAAPLPFSIIVNGVSATGYTGTKTAGACILVIVNGLITNVTGC